MFENKSNYLIDSHEDKKNAKQEYAGRDAF